MFFRRLRLAQIRAASMFMEGITRLPILAPLVGRARKLPVVRQTVNLVAGYNRVFKDLTSAQ
jgi:hypothetical protein